MPGNPSTSNSANRHFPQPSQENKGSPQLSGTDVTGDNEHQRKSIEERGQSSHTNAHRDETNDTTTATSTTKSEEGDSVVPNYVPPDFDAIFTMLQKDREQLTKEQFDEKYPFLKNLPPPRSSSPATAMALVDDILSGEFNRQIDEREALQRERLSQQQAQRPAEET